MTAKLFDLTGRRALVTGASQGIGQALARGLAAAGAEVVLNGRDAGRLAAAAGAIPGARLLAFDVTDHAAARAAIDGFEADTGPIDILVNNAGMQHRAPLEAFPADAFQQLLQTNIASVFNVGHRRTAVCSGTMPAACPTSKAKSLPGRGSRPARSATFTLISLKFRRLRGSCIASGPSTVPPAFVDLHRRPGKWQQQPFSAP